MLQQASTRLIIPEPSEDLIANEPWSIEIYADDLMDELFADIDDILHGSGNLPSQTVIHGSQMKSGNTSTPRKLEYVPLETVLMPQIILPNTQNQPVQQGSQGRYQQLSTFVVDPSKVKRVSKRPQKTRYALGRLVIIGTTLGVAIAGIIYLVQSGVVQLLNTKLTQQALLVPQPQSQLSPRAEIEAELVDYMLGALAVIDGQQAKNNYQSFKPRFSSEVTSNQTASNLPLLAANNTLPTPKRSGGVVERLYIPVYQAPSPMRFALPTIPGSTTPLPPVATQFQESQPNVVKTALNAVRQAAKPITVNMLAAAVRAELKPVPVRTVPITVRESPNPLPGSPVVPLRSAPVAESTPTITEHQVYLPTSVADNPSHTLEGLLELGNKSAALFKIDGVTRRINVGETIGTSGWTLVDVSNGEAVIRRNGEVRSIYAGQKL